MLYKINKTSKCLILSHNVSMLLKLKVHVGISHAWIVKNFILHNFPK